MGPLCYVRRFRIVAVLRGMFQRCQSRRDYGSANVEPVGQKAYTSIMFATYNTLPLHGISVCDLGILGVLSPPRTGWTAVDGKARCIGQQASIPNSLLGLKKTCFPCTLRQDYAQTVRAQASIATARKKAGTSEPTSLALLSLAAISR